jgi:hypothetical protein
LNDFLGGGHTREVTIASAVVEIVQYFVSFVDGKTPPKNGVDPTSIENVFDEEVSRGLMENASTIISREMTPKLLCLKVDKEVIVPVVIREHEEEVFIGEILIMGEDFASEGKPIMILARTRDFLLLGVEI